ncbi:MFS transporter [Azorhizophilus paspali]|uniref:MFS transporter n=2 Tax=Azorhizophilus paspali TaxID=69963 RepID=A0ABV6SJY0_AZOPA
MDSPKNKAVAYWTCIAYSSILMMSTNVASAVYPVYKSMSILNQFQITLVFAAYIFGLLPSLMISSWMRSGKGLRQTLLIALLAALLGVVIMGIGASFSFLIAGRLLQGISVGLSAGNLGAALVEYEPDGNHHRAALATGLSMTLGGGSAPMLGACFAQYTSHQLIAPYAFIFVLLLLLVPFVLMLPFSKEKQLKITFPKIPESVRPQFRSSAFAAFLTWTIPAMFLSVIPVVIANYLPSGNLLFPAAAAGLVLIVSGLSQAAMLRVSPKVNISIGSASLIVAAGLLIFAEHIGSPTLVMASAFVGGFGHGTTFLGATRSLNAVISGISQRPEVLLSYNFAIYLGVGLPVLCVGVLSSILTTSTAVSAFGGFVMLLSALLFLGNNRRLKPESATVF